MDNKIIVMIGKSGSGKDYISKYISNKYKYNFILSLTNRPMRYGEKQGDPYIFATTETMLWNIINNNFVEYRSYYTLYNNNPDVWYYGVLKEDVKDNKKYVVVLDKQGYFDFKKHFKDRVVSIFINTDDEIRRQRAIERGGYDETEFNRRLKDDNKVFDDLSIYDYIVNNNTTKKEFEKQIDKIMEEIDEK